MTNIFLETGKPATSEYVFIETLISHLDLKPAKLNCVDGKDNLPKILNQLQDNSIHGGKNLIIFDADYPETKGGFAIRNSEIRALLDGNGIDAEIFLFPDNSSEGDFESLLLQLVRRDLNGMFFDCFDDYERCLGDQYVTPNLKGKLFTYISAQKGLTKAQRDDLGKGKWQFDNPSFWNLDSDALLPLSAFLKQNLV